MMRRREFCQLAAAAAAGMTVPRAMGQTSGTVQPLPSEWNAGAIDYAKFCALPEDQRVFYALEDGKFVKQKLGGQKWEPSAWGKPPELPVAGGSWDGVPMNSPIAGLGGDGPYKPTWDSLLAYETPEWYRDAKFGIWAHWSPQCVPEDSDWYARKMYMQGEGQYKFQVEHFGHPSRFGYKDLCAQWTLMNWEPEELIGRYKKAGAKLFIALANHHDGFDTWNSKYQPWNAVSMGPHRDVTAEWAKAARGQGMRFGVTVHQARNWWWFQTSHGADQTGASAGLPYDGRLTMADGKDSWWEGVDPQRLYGVKHPLNALPDISYVKNFYDRTRDLIDQHDPDLLYFDNSLFPLGWAGMNIGSYFYNHNLMTHGGKLEAVVNIKEVPDRLAKSVVADYERGLTDRIMAYPWQSETCIGDWHYNLALYNKDGEYGGYLSPKDVIHWMVDAVSKNGTFILNVPGKPDGTIDSKEIAVLDGITEWMAVNGEAIYSTRPWTKYGEGPNVVKSGSFQGQSVSALGPKDIRFTRNKANTVIYVIALGWPTEPVIVEALGMESATKPGKIHQVELLGAGETLKWRQDAASLRVELPRQYRPKADYAAAFKVSLA